MLETDSGVFDCHYQEVVSGRGDTQVLAHDVLADEEVGGSDFTDLLELAQHLDTDSAVNDTSNPDSTACHGSKALCCHAMQQTDFTADLWSSTPLHSLSLPRQH